MPMGLSNPFSGQNSAWNNPSGWASGSVAFDDLDRMTAAQQTDFNAQAYNPDPSAFNIDRLPQQQTALRHSGQAAAVRTAAGLDQERSDQWRNQQMGFGEVLANRAMGNGPTAAGAQLQAGTDAAISAARANAAGSSNPALANRMAGQQIGTTVQQAANQATQLRAQEMNQAQDAFGNYLATARGQDLSAATANLSSEQQQRQMNDQMVQYYTSQGLTLEQAQLQARMALEELRAGQALGAQQIQSQIAMGDADRAQQAQAGVIGAAGSMLAAFSDERLKKDIAPADGEVRDFIKAIEPYRFKYKSHRHGASGEHFGVMAQDLEKSEMGKSLVVEVPGEGKAIDTVRGFGAVLAAMRHIDKRLEQVESKRRSFGAALAMRKAVA